VDILSQGKPTTAGDANYRYLLRVMPVRTKSWQEICNHHVNQRFMRQCLLTVAVLVFAAMACKRPTQDLATPVPPKPEVCGCIDTAALNYNSKATKTDGTQCKYAIDSVCGIYDVTDTQMVFTSIGPDTTVGTFSLTVTRSGASSLLFDAVLICDKCTKGAIPYYASYKGFAYTSYSDPYTSNNGSGHFDGDTIYYQQRITNSLSSYTPTRWGRGVKRR